MMFEFEQYYFEAFRLMTNYRNISRLIDVYPEIDYLTSFTEWDAQCVEASALWLAARFYYTHESWARSGVYQEWVRRSEALKLEAQEYIARRENMSKGRSVMGENWEKDKAAFFRKEFVDLDPPKPEWMYWRITKRGNPLLGG